MSESAQEHRRRDRVESREGADHKVRITCSCGKVAGKGFSKSLDTARHQASATFDGHVRRAGLAPEARRAEDRSLAGCLALVGAVVLAIVLFVGFGIVRALGGSDDDPGRDRSPGGYSDYSGGGTGGGIDCEKSVSALMERMYGSWGSGSWPDGEYNERLRVCRGH